MPVRLLKASGIYFSLVFGAGFLLGPVRVLIIEPRVGARVAELLEAPFMLAVIVAAGRWIGQRKCRGFSSAGRLAVGLIAAGIVLLADVVVGVGLRGMSVAQVFSNRDPITGVVYYALVTLTGLAPWWLGRHAAPPIARP